jgi:hypothetical protein
MDIFLNDPHEIPLPPDQVRITEIKADPYPDRRRVRVYLELTPFQKRPNADLVITNPDGHETARVSLIEIMMRKNELTVHLRGPQPQGEYTLRVSVYYTAPIPEPEPGKESEPVQLPESTQVDAGEITFTIAG